MEITLRVDMIGNNPLFLNDQCGSINDVVDFLNIIVIFFIIGFIYQGL